MPDTMSGERRAMLRAYGAELELTPGIEGMSGAIRRARELLTQRRMHICCNSFATQPMPKFRQQLRKSEDTDGQVDIMVVESAPVAR